MREYVRISGVDPATPTEAQPETTPGVVTVRFWASARAAAGTAETAVEVSGPVTLADLVARLDGSDRLIEVLAACSVLVGDRPVGTRDRADVLVPVGATVEFLPPFAGG